MVQSAALGPVASLSLQASGPRPAKSDELAPMLEPRWHRGSVSAGLHNMGNTCYLNSVLQCLAHLPPLGNLCHAQAHRNSCNSAQGCICCLVEHQLWRQLYSNNRAPFRPESLYSRVLSLNRGFIKGRQEDAHELLRCLTDAMEGCLLRQALGFNPQRRPRCPRTWVNSLFQGILQSQVRCLRCGHVSNSYDPFMDLSLELSNGCSTVKHCLDDYTAAERLDGKNMYRCDGCKQLVPADKQITIWDDPNILVVHLKRFHDFHGHKLTQHIDYPAVLCLEPYMCSTRRLQQPQQQQQTPWQQPRPPQQQQPRGLAVFNGSGYTRVSSGQTPKWGFGPQVSQQHQQQRQLQQRQQQHQLFLKQQQQHLQQQHNRQQLQQDHPQQQDNQANGAAAAAAATNRTSPGNYLLHGVLVHSGASANSGHYYSYVRSGEQPQKWFCANDSCMCSVTGSEAMSQVRSAYMLFYVRRNMKEQADLPAQPEAPATAAAAAGGPVAAAAAGPRPKRALDDGDASEGPAHVIGPQLPPHLLHKRQRLEDDEHQEQQMDMDIKEQQQPAAAAGIGPQLPPGWQPSAAHNGNGGSSGGGTGGGGGTSSSMASKLAAVAAAAAEAAMSPPQPQAAAKVSVPGSATALDAAAAEVAAAAAMPLPPAAAAGRAAEARMAAAAARGLPNGSGANNNSSSSSPWKPFSKPGSVPEAPQHVGAAGSGTAVRARPASPESVNVLAGLLPDYEDEEDFAPAQQPQQQQQHQPPQPSQQQERQQPRLVSVESAPAAGEEGDGNRGAGPDYERLKSVHRAFQPGGLLN